MSGSIANGLEAGQCHPPDRVESPHHGSPGLTRRCPAHPTAHRLVCPSRYNAARIVGYMTAPSGGLLPGPASSRPARQLPTRTVELGPGRTYMHPWLTLFLVPSSSHPGGHAEVLEPSYEGGYGLGWTRLPAQDEKTMFFRSGTTPLTTSPKLPLTL